MNTQPRTKKNKKKVRRRIGLIILTILLTAIIATASVVAYTYFFHEPDTGNDDPPPFDTSKLNETLPPETLSEAVDNESGSETIPAATEPVDPNALPRSEQKIYNFLFVGQDRVALNTDVIMLINFNTTTNKISIVQIPRDTYIRTNVYTGKINGLFAQYYMTNGKNTLKALRSMADTLEQSLCMRIHNVGHINLNGVVALVDSIGGVDVNVPVTISYWDDATQQTVVIPAGMQHLNGTKAEHFIRTRSVYVQADIGRIDAQKVFVSAFIKKLKSNFNVSTIASFVDVAFKYVSTDVSLADAVFFGKQLLQVDLEQIGMMSMVGSGAALDGLSYWVMVKKNMCEVINTYFNIYDFDINESIFDPNRIFTSASTNSDVNAIYTNRNIPSVTPHSAGEIEEDSLYIPHV